MTNTSYGTGGGRLGNVPSLQPTFTPVDALQPAVSGGTMRVMDTDFQSPLTHGWALSYQREVFKGNVLEVSYIGRRAENLFGAYDVNQAEIFGNGFLDAFNIVKAGGESALMNQLLGPGLAAAGRPKRARSSCGGSSPTNLQQNSVGAVAGALGSRLQGGRTLSDLSGLGPYFFYPYPQFLGSGSNAALSVIDSGGLVALPRAAGEARAAVPRRHSATCSATRSRSRRTRARSTRRSRSSATGSAQSASSTPFDIYDRALNYAPSDFDRRHIVQASFVTELPFGPGKWIGGNTDGVARPPHRRLGAGRAS